MPVRRTKAPARHSRPDLVAPLVSELSGASQGGPTAPLIDEEEQTYGGYIHVKVSWPEWLGAPLEERGAIIADAYEQAGLPDCFAKVTRTLGLTGKKPGNSACSLRMHDS